MHVLNAWMLPILLPCVLAAQNAAVTGRVVDDSGRAVVNARVSLAVRGDIDTTDAGGRFTLGATSGAVPGAGPAAPAIASYRGGVVRFTAGRGGARARARLYTLGGRHVADILDRDVGPGRHTVRLAAFIPATVGPGTYVVSFAIGPDTRRFLYVHGPGPAAGPSVGSSNLAGTALARTLAATDTVIVQKDGYSTARTPLSVYGTDIGDIVAEPFVVKLPHTTVVVDSDAVGVTLTPRDSLAAEIVIDTTGGARGVDTIEVGDILVFPPSSRVPNGALRTVTGVGAEVITTEPASVEEAFENLRFDTTITLTAAHLASGGAARKAGAARSGFELQTTFDDFVVLDLDGEGATGADRILASGYVLLDPAFHFDIEVRWFTLRDLELHAIMRTESEVTVRSSIDVQALSSDNCRVPIASFEFLPIPLMGGVVSVTPTIDIVVGCDGSVSAELSTGMSFAREQVAGVEYHDENWDLLSDCSQSFEAYPPELSAELALSAYLSCDAGFLIYGLAGPSVLAKASLSLDAAVGANPWWRLDCGLDIDAKGTVEMFKRTLAELDFDVFDWGRLLAQAAPAGFDAEAGDAAVYLSWNAYSDAEAYRIYMARSPAVSPETYESLPGGRVFETEALTRTIDGLVNDSTYWFVLTAYDRDDAVESFATAPLGATPYGAVTATTELVAPPDEAVDVDDTLTVTWRSHPDALTYDLQLGSGSSFDTLVADETGLPDTVATLYPLEPATSYHWRVRVVTADGPSGWTDPWEFTTAETPPAAPQALLPANGVTVSAAGPRYAWSRVARATGYRLQCAVSDAFSPTALDTTLADTSVEGPALQHAQRYVWRVRAENQAGPSAWCSTRSFTTTAPTGDTTILLTDGFSGMRLDSTKWTRSVAPTTCSLSVGDYARVEAGILELVQNGIDCGGAVNSVPLPIDTSRLVVMSSRTRVHYANEYLKGAFGLASAHDSLAGEWQWFAVARHWHYHYHTTRVGFGNTSAGLLDPIWNTWFDERMVYDPSSGEVTYTVNDTAHSSWTATALDTDSLMVRLQTNGWWTGHYAHVDTITVLQVPRRR